MRMMSKSGVLATIFASFAVCQVYGQDVPVSDLILIVCERKPELSYCRRLFGDPTTTTIPRTTTTSAAQTTTSIPPLPVLLKLLSFYTTVAQHAPTTTTTTTTTATTTITSASVTAVGDDYSELCTKYRDHYFFYCFGENGRAARAREYCPIYQRNCPELAKRGPAEQPAWFPEVPTTTLAPCTYICSEKHCTDECKCAYQWRTLERQCTGQAAFALLLSQCQLFHASCGKFGFNVDFEEFKKQTQANKTPIARKHSRKQHAQFWTNPNSQHTDWLHGDISNAQDWGVPALGISGTAKGDSIKFPSLGDFLGVEDPFADE